VSPRAGVRLGAGRERAPADDPSRGAIRVRLLDAAREVVVTPGAQSGHQCAGDRGRADRADRLQRARADRAQVARDLLGPRPSAQAAPRCGARRRRPGPVRPARARRTVDRGSGQAAVHPRPAHAARQVPTRLPGSHRVRGARLCQHEVQRGSATEQAQRQAGVGRGGGWPQRGDARRVGGGLATAALGATQALRRGGRDIRADRGHGQACSIRPGPAASGIGGLDAAAR